MIQNTNDIYQENKSLQFNFSAIKRVKNIHLPFDSTRQYTPSGNWTEGDERKSDGSWGGGERVNALHSNTPKTEKEGILKRRSMDY